MQKLQLLQQLYSKLAKHGDPVVFHNMALRDVDHHGRLERPFFAVAVLLAAEARHDDDCFIIMVTASHNPPGYNGLKVDALSSEVQFNETYASQVTNRPERTIELVKKLCSEERKAGIFYVGRDKRPTSTRLSSILIDTLTILGRRVIDLGQRSTPEVFSLSSYLYQRRQTGTQLLQEIHTYFKTIKTSFCSAIELISAYFNRQWKTKTIVLDFSNGVGGASLKDYHFLNDYFQIKTINYENFEHPNLNCGAQWLYKHFKDHQNLPDLSAYPQGEQYYFFDGDSDRIIAKMSKENIPIDGDDFNACFVKLIRMLLNSINMESQEITSVGNITSNDSLGKYLQAIGGVVFKKVPVGVRNLWQEVKKHQIGCYFENSGHGCLYFSKKIRLKLEKIMETHWQAKLLILLDQLSRNNSRGYAFHNMLIFQIYLFYCGTNTGFLFQKAYILNRQYSLSRPELFENGNTAGQLLERPTQLIEFINNLQKQYTCCTILLRKSNTIPIVRLTVQGKKKECQMIVKQFEATVKQLSVGIVI